MVCSWVKEQEPCSGARRGGRFKAGVQCQEKRPTGQTAPRLHARPVLGRAITRAHRGSKRPTYLLGIYDRSAVAPARSAADLDHRLCVGRRCPPARSGGHRASPQRPPGSLRGSRAARGNHHDSSWISADHRRGLSRGYQLACVGSHNDENASVAPQVCRCRPSGAGGLRAKLCPLAGREMPALRSTYPPTVLR